MTRDPQALHVGLHVLTPNGPGVIRARRGGPITTWLALDFWWRESQITVPEPPEPGDISPRCKAGRHEQSSDGCGGGFIHGDQLAGCTCRCHGGPRWRDELEDEVA